ncbi:hypothetical protein BDV12DRAFT_204761 [Aspergillus spectabilis]
MTRPIRRRGRRPTGPVPVPVQLNESQGHNSHNEESGVKSLRAIRRLVRIYRDTMYQCYFPFLSEADLLVRWDTHLPERHTPSYTLLMALCAVASRTASLDAIFDNTLLSGSPPPSSPQYFFEAIASVTDQTHTEATADADANTDRNLDVLRIYGLLSVYYLRAGNHPDLHRYLGLYHAAVAQTRFHDELHWPSSISQIEIDNRRRLFWCVYRLEVHSACVSGHVVRLPEAQVSVRYPRITRDMDIETQAWMAGLDYIRICSGY